METINDLPLMERPREKLLHLGAAKLSNAELIAILLGSGSQHIPVMSICGDLVTAINDQPEQLYAMTIEQLCKIRGIGEVKAIVLIAALELGKRAVTNEGKPLVLETDTQVQEFLAPYYQQQIVPGYFLLLLNHRKELLATTELSIIEHKPPEIKALIKTVLESGASEFVLCRKEQQLQGKYLNEEKAFIIQLDAAASMLQIKMQGRLIGHCRP